MTSNRRSLKFTVGFLLIAACVLIAAQVSGAAATRPSAEDETAIRANVKDMETGWNTKSGALFARPFAEDADYVVINGMHVKGREQIEQGHQHIFDTIYKNTTLGLSVKQVRFLRPDVALVHVLGHTKRPQANGARETDVIITLVMIRERGQWKITAFQNTEIVRS